MTENILMCPVCGCELHREEKSYFCSGTKRHCFDISSAGHANLCPGKATGGDAKEAVKSRTEFLCLDYYKPISDKICEIINRCENVNFIVDAGCGEGYYTNNIARATKALTYGFDLSKEAIISASKSAKRQGIDNANYFVGGIYSLPILDGSVDVLTNVFAPCAESEFSRVLRDGGILIVASSGKRHLYGLKEAIYDTVYTNEERADSPKNMELLQKHIVSYEIELNNQRDIQNLFSMTPYSYRTSEKDMKKLLSLETLTTEVEVEIALYRKG